MKKNITLISVEELSLYDRNPRKITEYSLDKLCKSIQEDPEFMNARPLLVNKINNQMIVYAGNQRLTAVKKLGWKQVPCLVEEISDELMKARMLKDNISAGEFDFEILNEDFDKDYLDDIMGMDESFIEDTHQHQKLQKENDSSQIAEEDEYTPPDDLNDIETEIKEGDLICIGKHRLLCGDSTLASSYQILMGGGIADMVLTDPPYNVDYTGANNMKIMNDKMPDEKFYQFLLDFYTSANKYLKKGGIWYVWHSDTEGLNFRLAMKSAGIKLRQNLVWVKSQLVMGRQDYQWKHEPCLDAVNQDEEFDPCLYGWKDGAAHEWYSNRKQTTVLNFEKPSKSALHPTMKPIPLFGYLINNSTRPGDKVLDPFIGSGTSMVASEEMNRTCYAMDMDPKYCQVVIDRMIENYPGIKVTINEKVYERKEQAGEVSA